MAVTLTFETDTCGRCGGTGQHSYNQLHGSVCYGCGGKKVAHTKAGAKAKKAYYGFLQDRLAVRVSDVVVGQLIKPNVDKKAARVIRIDVGGTRYRVSHNPETGEETWEDGITLVFPSKRFGESGWGFHRDSIVYRGVVEEDIRAFIAANPKLKGVTLNEGVE
jgi:hypothetical protein